MIEPKAVNEVTEALRAMLQASPRIAEVTGNKATIERSAPGDDQNKCPWIGIFRFAQSFPTRVLGVPAGFRYHRIELGVAVQEVSHESGEDCENRLETLLSAVIATILGDTTLGNTVDTIDSDMLVQYPDQRLKDDVYMQLAVVNFTAITTVRVTE